MTAIDAHGNIHDRGGRFSGRVNSRPAGGMPSATHGEAGERPFRVLLLDEPDESGGFDTLIEAPSGTRYLRGSTMVRDDGPAYIGVDGTKEYWADGELVDVEIAPEEIPGVMDRTGVARLLKALTGRSMRLELWAAAP